jgi:tryptophan synthase alpha subunit
VRDVCSYADGAIVGSHLVSALARGGSAAVSEATESLVHGTSRENA